MLNGYAPNIKALRYMKQKLVFYDFRNSLENTQSK